MWAALRAAESGAMRGEPYSAAVPIGNLRNAPGLGGAGAASVRDFGICGRTRVVCRGVRRHGREPRGAAAVGETRGTNNNMRVEEEMRGAADRLDATQTGGSEGRRATNYKSDMRLARIMRAPARPRRDGARRHKANRASRSAEAVSRREIRY